MCKNNSWKKIMCENNSWKIRTSGEGDGYGNSDTPGQGEV